MEALRIETKSEMTETVAEGEASPTESSNGEPADGDELIMKYERMVAWLAYETIKRRCVKPWDPIDADDLKQVGRIALLSAKRKYDALRGTRFSTYAYSAIRNAMSKLCDKSEETFERVNEQDGLSRLWMNDGKSREVSSEGSVNVSFHDRTGRDALMHVTLTKMKRRFDKLSRKQQRVLWRRYGLGDQDAEPVSETAKYFHLAKASVRKIEAEALAALREMMEDGQII